MAADGGMSRNLMRWMARNAVMLDALAHATKDDTVFVQISFADQHRNSEFVFDCKWGLGTTLFGSETEHAAAARWQTERLLWLALRPDSPSALSILPAELLKAIVTHVWSGSEYDLRRSLDEGDGEGIITLKLTIDGEVVEWRVRQGTRPCTMWVWRAISYPSWRQTRRWQTAW